MSRFNRSALLGSTALAGALGMLLASPSQAQTYGTAPGLSVSLEGRYQWNVGSKARNYWLADHFNFPEIKPYTPTGAAADHGPGAKLTLGYRFGNNWDVGFGLSIARMKGHDHDTTFNYINSRVHPKGPAADLQDNIDTRLTYATVDFEAGYTSALGGSASLRLFGGIRFAAFDQTAKGTIDHVLAYNGYYNYSGKRKTRFTGVGPRLGLNGTIDIGNSGFNLFGGLSGALLYGQLRDRHDFNFVGTRGLVSGRHYPDEKKNKLVPNVEGEIGIGYNFKAGDGTTLGLQIGYRGEAFFGAASKGYAIYFWNNADTGNYLFHGPFARLVATFGAAATPTAAPPPSPPAVGTNKSFIVFFDFDKSTITAQAQKTIDDAIAAAKAGHSARLTLTGHTDRSGSEQYNLALSLRRAEAVKAAMIKQGIPASAIVVIGKGESQPLVPTADGVREPQNRRVEIVI